MRYEDFERSPYSGKPFELFHFYRGTEEWNFVGKKRSVTFNGDTYLPLPIKRGRQQAGGADSPGMLDVVFPTDTDLGLILQTSDISAPIQLTIYKWFKGGEDDARIIFLGEVESVDVEIDQCTARCTPLTAQMDIMIPQVTVQKKQCAWVTYDQATCKVDLEDFTFESTVATIDGLTLTIDGLADYLTGIAAELDNYFTLGVLTSGERKGFIESQSGDTVVLSRRIPGMLVGDTVSLLAGDDRTKETCKNKFDNIGRFMAFDQIPQQNPFYGQGIRA